MADGTAAMVLVPREPTNEMLDAGARAWLNDEMRRSSTLYRAMVAAAPPVPVEPAEPAAFIEHHKGGDNLVWDDPGGKRTPLYLRPAPAVCDPVQAVAPACPSNPAADHQQAGLSVTDEREAFDVWWGSEPVGDFDGVTAEHVWRAWQARAALASQPPAEDARDAARYRFLREYRTGNNGPDLDVGWNGSHFEPLRGLDLDSAVDAEMRRRSES